MHPAEVSFLTQVGPYAFGDFEHHAVRIAPHLLGSIFGQLGNRGLGGEPVAGVVLVEVGSGGRQPPERIPEHRRRLSRHHAAQLDAAVVDPPVGGSGSGGGTEENRPRNAATGGELSQVRLVAVDPQRQRVRAVDILLDDRRPVVVEVPGQLRLYARVFERDAAGQDEGTAITSLPLVVNHRRHQPQHAARALELRQRRPVGVQPIEHLRVNGIRFLDPLLVVGLPALGGEFLLLRAVQVGEAARHHVASRELRGIQGLKQPAPHDPKALLGARRAPGSLDPTNHVTQTAAGRRARAGRPLPRRPHRRATTRRVRTPAG